MKFKFIQTGAADADIFDHDVQIAQIRDLQLCNVRFRPEGQVIIGEQTPMPLFWRQYRQHQHPERHAGSHAKLTLLQENDDALVFACQGYNQSRQIASHYLVRLEYAPAYGSYLFRSTARLTIPAGGQWQILRNPFHGEVEFCNFWPEGSFSPIAGFPKKYQACYLQRGATLLRIVHHHLETSDKHNISMTKGDRFLWLLEEENPVVELLSDVQLQCGLCAYMWDAHFGLAVTQPGQEQLLLDGPQEFAVEFQIYAIDQTLGRELAGSAQTAVPADLQDIPIVMDGIHTFRHTAMDFAGQLSEVWPWAHETDAPALTRFYIDRENGYDDHFSLQIIAEQPATSQWLATTLGPAFGHPPFPDQVKYKLSGYVKTEHLHGEAGLLIRLHQPGQGDLYKPAGYRHFKSAKTVAGSSEWQRVEVLTPVISPPPDRLHLVLQQQGRGTSWFDNVLLETINQ